MKCPKIITVENLIIESCTLFESHQELTNDSFRPCLCHLFKNMKLTRTSNTTPSVPYEEHGAIVVSKQANIVIFGSSCPIMAEE